MIVLGRAKLPAHVIQKVELDLDTKALVIGSVPYCADSVNERRIGRFLQSDWRDRKILLGWSVGSTSRLGIGRSRGDLTRLTAADPATFAQLVIASSSRAASVKVNLAKAGTKER